MKIHPTEWLSAYYDGELSREHNQEIQKHIENCEACQDQLKQMAELSKCLKEIPTTVHLESSEVFMERLAGRLPERKPREPRKNQLAIWWLMPVILVASWAFLQALFFISGLLLQLDSIELASINPIGSPSLLGRLLSMAVLPRSYTWLTAILNNVPNHNVIFLFLMNFFANSICCILLGSWLFSWFSYRKNSYLIQPKEFFSV